MAPPRVRVYLADDHPLFLEGVTRAVGASDALELVGSAASGDAALADLRRLVPDVAVLDMRMNGMDGREILAAAGRERLPTRIVLLSAYADDELVYDTLAAGAVAYLSKEVDRQAIVDAMLAVARGDIVLSPSAQTGLVRELRRREAAMRPALTVREREVLSLAAQGITTADIAARLELGAATVKTHLQKTYEKLGVTDRAAAVALALRRGLLD